MSTTQSMTLNAEYLKSKFEQAHAYDAYVATGTDAQKDGWQKIYDQARLTDEQVKLVGAFTRQMKVLVSSGVWCGDCVQQIPLLEKIAEASNGTIDLRIVDRDEHSDLAEQIQICGGMRVPVAIFMAEDFELVSLFGDRTLTRYRAIAKKQLGAACAIPGAPVPDDELAGTLQDWLDEVERVHLLLRLSTRLRQKHND
ncbi:MAG: thioredoxin family protein [bacterium]|nr:thioredoxin family protein [bacterium]